MRPAEPVGLFEFGTELEEALDLLGPLLRPHNSGLLRLEYPLVYAMPGRGEVRVLRKDGKPVAGAAFAAFDTVTDPPTGLRIGGIGSVGTHPDWRGSGCARQVLVECEAALRSQGCSLAILWSHLPEVFRRCGYIEAGVEVDFAAYSETVQRLPRIPGVVLPFDREKDLEDCLLLYGRQPVRALRSLEEFSRLVGIPGMEIFVHHRAGRATAYAALGKGSDFPGTIHEWGGEVGGLIGILRSLLSQGDRESVTVISPLSRPDLIAELSGRLIEPLYGILGMMKILDRDRLAGQLEGAFPSRPAIRIRPAEEGFLLQGPRGELFQSEEEFLKFVFGYRGVWGGAGQAAERLGLPWLKERVPVGLFLWGLDSV